MPPPELEEFYASSYRRLVGVVAAAAGSAAEAEEVVQEAFVRLLPRWQRVQGFEDPEAWVRGVAFRLLSNRLRKARNGVRALLVHGPPALEPPPNPDRLDVERALADLTLSQRQVVVLHHLVQMDVLEIAAVLNLPVGTVKSRLSRGRVALAAALSDPEGAHA